MLRIVVAAERFMPRTQGGAAALVGSGEAHGLAVAGDEIVLVGHDGLRETSSSGLPVFVLAQVDGDDAARRGEL